MNTVTIQQTSSTNPATLVCKTEEGLDYWPLSASEQELVERWSSKLRTDLTHFRENSPIDNASYDAPRRKDPDPQKARLAISIAALLYPAPSDSVLGPLIKYEKDIRLLRRAIVAQREDAELASAKVRYKPTWNERILAQGPWDALKDPLSLKGTPALPMPVTVSSEETLKPFFEHLQNGGSYLDGKIGKEEYYETEMGEWEKGILYRDGRMDLCKMVVGPPHITALLDSLETNEFVRHFLLGNNMIGPTGARRIAAFIAKYPSRMETWYLAGNCISTADFKKLATAFIASPSITNIWLKRNPLGPGSANPLVELITRSPNLRTLDLDQTELGDAGVGQLFSGLATTNTPNPTLRNIYLNGTGIGHLACQYIGAYFRSSNCLLESLYVSNNPVGDAGAEALALGLKGNTSLTRLNVRSCGLTSTGAIAILDALAQHPCIKTLDLGYSFATEDLEMRYNYIDDSISDAVITLIETGKTLQYLDLGLGDFSTRVLAGIYQAVPKSDSLLVFKAGSLHGHANDREIKAYNAVRQNTRERLASNVKAIHGNEMDYETFQQGEQRWLISPKDVRLIDSSYRNRDTGLAMRGEMVLKKWWTDEAEIERVLKGDQP